MARRDESEHRVASLRQELQDQAAKYEGKILELEKYILLVDKIIAEEKSKPRDNSIADEVLKKPVMSLQTDEASYQLPLAQYTGRSNYRNHGNFTPHNTRSPKLSPKESLTSVLSTPRSIYSNNHVVGELKGKVSDLLQQIDNGERRRISIETDLVSERLYRKQCEDKIQDLESIVQQLNEKIANLTKKQAERDQDNSIKILSDGYALQLKKAKQDADLLRKENDRLTASCKESSDRVDAITVEMAKLKSTLDAKDRELRSLDLVDR
jgi:hypothetical protein